jgi:FkbM family methyltransferase
MAGARGLRRAVLSAATRLGLEPQTKRLRAIASPGLRRDLRDHAALRAIFAVALRPDSHVIDVGANHGAVLAEMVRLAPRGRHLAFEPVPLLHAELAAAFPGVDVREVALSDDAGEATFHHVVSADGYSGLRRRSYPGRQTVRELRVRTARLDDELPEGFAPALVKIDVEGAELHVLRGAAETLARHRPVVVFEHGQGAAEHYGATSGEVWDVLAAAGLRVFDLAGEGPYSRARFEESFTLPVWNWVATG